MISAVLLSPHSRGLASVPNELTWGIARIFVRYVDDRICLRLAVAPDLPQGSTAMLENKMRGFCVMNNRDGLQAAKLINGLRREVIDEQNQRKEDHGIKAPVPAEGYWVKGQRENAVGEEESGADSEPEIDNEDEFDYWDTGA